MIDIIKKYPKIFQSYDGNPGMVNWLSVPDGWLRIIDALCNSIQDYIDSTYIIENGQNRIPEQVTCIQVKEKFGGLRFYVSNADDYVNGMIRMAETLCYNICDECGSSEDLGVTSGWISVKCRNCIIKHGDIAMVNWNPKKS